MLSLLHIENIAVIESADIQFDKGFNALTGETGAGKSIVVDAIGAIIGERTSRDLIRTGARSALVNAVFTGLPPLAWFQENGGGPDEDGNLLIQREIQPDGKNVCRLNGRLITVAQLRQLAGSSSISTAARRPAAPGRAVPPGVSGWIRRNGIAAGGIPGGLWPLCGPAPGDCGSPDGRGGESPAH